MSAVSTPQEPESGGTLRVYILSALLSAAAEKNRLQAERRQIVDFTEEERERYRQQAAEAQQRVDDLLEQVRELEEKLDAAMYLLENLISPQMRALSRQQIYKEVQQLMAELRGNIVNYLPLVPGPDWDIFEDDDGTRLNTRNE